MQTQLRLLCLTLVSATLLNSCKGPTGDPGPQGGTGLTGTTGNAGATGPTGDPGIPNVVYSDWKTIDWLVSDADFKETGRYELSPTTTANALFTKEAINTAAIFTYVKYTTLQTSVVVGGLVNYKLVERISNVSNGGFVYHYFKMPGRVDATALDYGYAYIRVNQSGENFFSPVGYLDTYTDFLGGGRLIPELQNKSVDFVRSLVKDYPQFRHVIVYQGTKGGRLATIDWNNYDEVKQTLQLKD